MRATEHSPASARSVAQLAWCELAGRFRTACEGCSLHYRAQAPEPKVRGAGERPQGPQRFQQHEQETALQPLVALHDPLPWWLIDAGVTQFRSWSSAARQGGGGPRLRRLRSGHHTVFTSKRLRPVRHYEFTDRLNLIKSASHNFRRLSVLFITMILGSSSGGASCLIDRDQHYTIPFKTLHPRWHSNSQVRLPGAQTPTSCLQQRCLAHSCSLAAGPQAPGTFRFLAEDSQIMHRSHSVG